MMDGFVIYAVIAKAALYIATFGAVGGLVFQRLFLPRDSDIGHRLSRLIKILGVTSILMALAQFSATAMLLTGEVAGVFDRSIFAILWQGPSGLSLRLRLLGGVLLLGGYFSSDRYRIFAFVGALLMLASFGAMGHVDELPTPLGYFILLLHISVVAFWVGSFIPFYWLSRTDDVQRVAGIARRFGSMAMLLIPLLILAGALYGYLLLGSFAALFTTTYGQVLLLKVITVSAVLLFAALNKTRFVPLMIAGKREGARYFNRSLVFEGVLALCVFVLTAILTSAIEMA